MYASKAHADLKLLRRRMDGLPLNPEEYAQLIEHGILESADGEMQCLWIEGAETRKLLLEIGDRIRRRYHAEMNALRRSYIDAVRQRTPAPLRTMRGYGLQFTFYVDGWFVLHCLKELVNGGRLQLPTEAQKRALMTIVVHE